MIKKDKIINLRKIHIKENKEELRGIAKKQPLLLEIYNSKKNKFQIIKHNKLYLKI